MKTLKFRAWDKVREVMREVESIDFYPLENLVQCTSGHFGGSNDFPLMQYMGKDKEDKEIYEGDIVLTPGGQRLEVVIDNIAEGDMKFYHIGLGNCKVIGNIYENGECA